MNDLTRDRVARHRPLPDGWRWVRLGDVCDVVNGYGFPERLQGQSTLPYPFVKVSDMNAIGSESVVCSARNTVDDAILAELGARTYPAGTVVFPKVGGALLTNKKRVLGVRAAFDNNVMGVVPIDVESSWLFRWMQTVDLRTLANTQALPSVRQSVIADLRLPLPPPEERIRILAILDEQLAAVEKARKACEEQLEAAKALPAAYLRTVFPRPGQELPHGWRWVTLRQACETKTGLRDPRSSADEAFVYVDISSIDTAGKRIVSPKTLLGREAPSRARKEIRAGDVIVSTTRPNLNAVALVPQELDGQICSTGFCVLRATEALTSEVLFAYVQSAQFVDALSSLVTGALYPAVTDGQVFSQPIPLPPLAEQTRIAALLRERMAAAEKARRACEERLEAIRTLPAVVLRKAFNGEL